jgi:hypothetical protein
LARDEALLRQKDELLTQRERLTLIVQKSAIPPPSRPRKIFVQKQRQRSLHTGFFFLDGILGQFHRPADASRRNPGDAVLHVR